MGLRDQGLILRVARICGSRVEGIFLLLYQIMMLVISRNRFLTIDDS